jgi:hypothetical protein
MLCFFPWLLLSPRFGVDHVYCWHGLPAYWGGIMPGAPALGPAGQIGRLVYPKPTASIAEVEPSLLWSPAVLAGEWGTEYRLANEVILA